MSIKIGELFIITRDKYQWALGIKSQNINTDTGEPCKTYKYTYHATLKQVAKEIVHFHEYQGDISNLLELHEVYRKVVNDITTELGVRLK